MQVRDHFNPWRDGRALAFKKAIMETQTGNELIVAERTRQIEVEGWTPEHDDEHTAGQLANAAFCYEAYATCQVSNVVAPSFICAAWPWDWAWWKPASNSYCGIIRNYVKAGALYLAERERIARLNLPGVIPQERLLQLDQSVERMAKAIDQSQSSR